MLMPGAMLGGVMSRLQGRAGALYVMLASAQSV